MKTVNTEAIVLRRVNYGEADRIITVLSAELGKVSVMAKGVRKLKSKLAGGIEPLAINSMTLIEGKKDLYTLRSARMDKQMSSILSSIERSDLAFTALKQINKLVEETEGVEFYRLLNVYLQSLNLNLDLVLAEVWWILRILSILGHQPNLKTDSNGNDLKQNQNYFFNPEEGTFSPTEIESVRVFNSDHIKFWRLALQLQPTKLASIKNGKVLAQDSLEPLRLFQANQT
ncbi:DNA repair protein RecO [Candidatus Saccharibacteria bacterium]|nr:DNA repair protein RecO [Candidatus Saccharibacteria bacterium]